MEPTSGWFSFGAGNGNTPPTNTMRMGYCPQMDALDYLLTVKETLEIYANLRGLSSKILDKVNTILENVLKIVGNKILSLHFCWSK